MQLAVRIKLDTVHPTCVFFCSTQLLLKLAEICEFCCEVLLWHQRGSLLWLQRRGFMCWRCGDHFSRAKPAFFRLSIKLWKIHNQKCSRASGGNAETKINGLMLFFLQNQQSCHFVQGGNKKTLKFPEQCRRNVSFKNSLLEMSTVSNIYYFEGISHPRNERNSFYFHLSLLPNRGSKNIKPQAASECWGAAGWWSI